MPSTDATPRPTDPRLRLAGRGVLPAINVLPAHDALEPGDPRWALAVRIAASLRDDRGPWSVCAARTHAHRVGARLRFAPHEIDAIGALVLEAARGSADPVIALRDTGVVRRLAMIRRPEPEAPRRDLALDSVAIALGTAVLVVAVALWVANSGV